MVERGGERLWIVLFALIVALAAIGMHASARHAPGSEETAHAR